MIRFDQSTVVQDPSFLSNGRVAILDLYTGIRHLSAVGHLVEEEVLGSESWSSWLKGDQEQVEPGPTEVEVMVSSSFCVCKRDRERGRMEASRCGTTQLNIGGMS